MDSLCPILLGQTLMTTASEMFPQQVLVPCSSSSAPPRLCPFQSLPVSTSIECKYFCLAVKTVCHLPLKPAGPPTCPVSHLVPLGLLSRSSCLHMSLQDPTPTPCTHRPRPVALPASSNHALHSALPVPLCGLRTVHAVHQLCFSGPQTQGLFFKHSEITARCNIASGLLKAHNH